MILPELLIKTSSLRSGCDREGMVKQPPSVKSRVRPRDHD